MDELKGKLNAVYEKLGAKKEKKEEKKEGEEEKKEREDPFQKINDEWKQLQAKIDAKRQEKREVRNAFFEQKRQYNEFSSKNRRMRVARSVLEQCQHGYLRKSLRLLEGTASVCRNQQSRAQHVQQHLLETQCRGT